MNEIKKQIEKSLDDDKSTEELTDDDFGYKYTIMKDGTISVRHSEIKKMLDKQNLTIMGHYVNVDDCEYYVETEFEDLIKRCVIGNRDMFGNEWRLSLRKVKQIIEKVYYENGWDEIYDYEEVK